MTILGIFPPRQAQTHAAHGTSGCIGVLPVASRLETCYFLESAYGAPLCLSLHYEKSRPRGEA